MTLKSMTGFASLECIQKGYSWNWDIRTVNGRGLDVKVRLPEGMDVLEPAVRERVAGTLKRGSVHVSLRRTARADDTSEPMQLKSILDDIKYVHSAAERAGVLLAPPSVADVLEGRLGPLRAQAGPQLTQDLEDALKASLADVLLRLDEARQGEGRALLKKLTALVNTIADLTADARKIDVQRRAARRDIMSAAFRRVMHNAAELDPGRLEQELAIIAVKSDVVEELDRLDAHVEAARALLADDQPVGRRFDFLTQEFNREANTLCSKAQFTELTRVGLDLKAVIDQVREQVQNVE